MTTRDDVIANLTAPGQRFAIQTEQVLGHSMEVFANREHCLAKLLRASRRYGDREYLVSERSRYTFDAHYRAAAALATALRERYGVRSGDRVALCGANSPEGIVAFWAVAALGAITVGVNSMWVAPEIAYGLELTEPVLLIADRPRRALLTEPAIPVLSFEDDVPALVAEYAGAPLPEVEVAEDDPAAILFTSGTTGRPKGATHSHRNVIAAVWFHLLNDAIQTELGNPPADRRFLLATPLFHIAALHNLAVVRLAVGDTAVLHLGRFDIDTVLRLIERERVTNWGAVPTMISRLLETDASNYDLSSLRTISVSSAPSSSRLKDQLRQQLPAAGQTLTTNYGLTESSTAATLALPAELAANPNTVGRPVPTMRVEIRDAAGDRVPDGVDGEIYLRGAHMMLGYWRDPAATSAASAPDGWFRTGDVGTMVDGGLHVSSRRSDLILRGAENVYPAEVEEQLVGHPEVRECIVLGTEDADYGQAVAAVVVVRPGSPVTEADLAAHAKSRLAAYKVPTRWLLTTEELPRNATGKVQRQQVTLP